MVRADARLSITVGTVSDCVERVPVVVRVGVSGSSCVSWREKEEGREGRGRTAREPLRAHPEDPVDPVPEGLLLLRDADGLLVDQEAVAEVDAVHPCAFIQRSSELIRQDGSVRPRTFLAGERAAAVCYRLQNA